MGEKFKVPQEDILFCQWMKGKERKVNRPIYPTAFSISTPANVELGTSLGFPGSTSSHLWCTSPPYVFRLWVSLLWFIHSLTCLCLFQKFVELPALNMADDWCMLLTIILAKFWKILWGLWIGFYYTTWTWTLMFCQLGFILLK